MNNKPAATLCILFCMMSLLMSCGNREQTLFEEVLRISKPDYYEGRELEEADIEELKMKIKLYEEKVNEKVEAYGNLGVYYKMLAVRYIDAEMYELALESLEKAIRIYPENSILFYLSGVCCGRTAKAKIEEEGKQELLKTAEKYYQRALELDPNYVDALYGLSILYVFEMDRPYDAEPLLDTILQKQPYNTDAMFLLARVYVSTGRIDQAVELYDEIIEETDSRERKQSAQENKQKLLEGAYEL